MQQAVCAHAADLLSQIGLRDIVESFGECSSILYTSVYRIWLCTIEQKIKNRVTSSLQRSTNTVRTSMPTSFWSDTIMQFLFHLCRHHPNTPASLHLGTDFGCKYLDGLLLPVRLYYTFIVHADSIVLCLKLNVGGQDRQYLTDMLQCKNVVWRETIYSNLSIWSRYTRNRSPFFPIVLSQNRR